MEIQKKLKGYKLNYNLRRINEILVNPFYCGRLAHKALEGEVVLIFAYFSFCVKQIYALQSNQQNVNLHKW